MGVNILLFKLEENELPDDMEGSYRKLWNYTKYNWRLKNNSFYNTKLIAK